MLPARSTLTVRTMLPPRRIAHVDWNTPEIRPRMANDLDLRPGLGLTNRSILRDGEPWIPVTAEMHFSRQPRERWAAALRLMKAGGINVVASYIFWIHHQPTREEPSFEGNLDLAAFVDLCARGSTHHYGQRRPGGVQIFR